jgi:hypothetical protein
MKTQKQIEEFLKITCRKEKEKILDCKITNGQYSMGIKKALEWVLKK